MHMDNDVTIGLIAAFGIRPIRVPDLDGPLLLPEEGLALVPTELAATDGEALLDVVLDALPEILE